VFVLVNRNDEAGKHVIPAGILTVRIILQFILALETQFQTVMNLQRKCTDKSPLCIENGHCILPRSVKCVLLFHQFQTAAHQWTTLSLLFPFLCGIFSDFPCSRN
jgi:hypothetical protein